MLTHSNDRPQGVYPVITGGRTHHCNRPDCVWFYDGTEIKRSIPPRHVKTLIEESCKHPHDLMYHVKYIAELEKNIREMRERRFNCELCDYPHNCECHTRREARKAQGLVR